MYHYSLLLSTVWEDVEEIHMETARNTVEDYIYNHPEDYDLDTTKDLLDQIDDLWIDGWIDEEINEEIERLNKKDNKETLTAIRKLFETPCVGWIVNGPGPDDYNCYTGKELISEFLNTFGTGNAEIRIELFSNSLDWTYVHQDQWDTEICYHIYPIEWKSFNRLEESLYIWDNYPLDSPWCDDPSYVGNDLDDPKDWKDIRHFDPAYSESCQNEWIEDIYQMTIADCIDTSHPIEIENRKYWFSAR